MSLRVADPLKSLIPAQTIYVLGYLLLGFMLLGLIDIHFFQSQFSNLATLTQYPSLYVPLIAFPHILSSLIILFSNYKVKEVQSYINFKIVPVVILGIVLLTYDAVLFDVMFLVLITQHIAGQTIGLLKMANGASLKSNWLLIWKWLNYPNLAVSFLMIYCNHLKIALIPYLDQIITLGWISALASLVWTLWMILKQRKDAAHIYMLLMFQMYFFGIFYFSLKMNLFYWGIVFILGHDVMAFLVYHNYFSNILNGKAFVISFLIPLILSVGLISLAVSYGFPQLVFLFQFAHYFSERYCWKQASPLRASIGMRT